MSNESRVNSGASWQPTRSALLLALVTGLAGCASPQPGTPVAPQPLTAPPVTAQQAPATPPRPSGGKWQPGQPVPSFCADPQITNPNLRAECPPGATPMAAAATPAVAQSTAWHTDECPGHQQGMMKMRYGLSSGSTIINDNGSGGAIQVQAGMPIGAFMAAAKKQKIEFTRGPDDTIVLKNSFFACALFFKDGKLSEIED